MTYQLHNIAETVRVRPWFTACGRGRARLVASSTIGRTPPCLLPQPIYSKQYAENNFVRYLRFEREETAFLTKSESGWKPKYFIAACCPGDNLLFIIPGLFGVDVLELEWVRCPRLLLRLG